MAASWSGVVFCLLLALGAGRGQRAASESAAAHRPRCADDSLQVRLRVAEIRAEAHVRAAEVTAEQHRRHLRDFRTCAWLIGGLTGGLTGAILVGYPIRELYNKVCAALDAVARQAVDPIRAAINAHAAAIAGVLTTSWLVARDWPLRLCNGVAGGVAYCLVAARQRRLQGAAARR